jgi:hypothetical protein
MPDVLSVLSVAIPSAKIWGDALVKKEKRSFALFSFYQKENKVYKARIYAIDCNEGRK